KPTKEKSVKEKSVKEEKGKVVKVDNEGEVVMTDAPTVKEESGDDVQMKDAQPTAAEVPKKQIYHPILDDLMERLRPIKPEDTWNKLSLPFYVTFWQLSMYDLHCPVQPYDDENRQLLSQMHALNSNQTISLSVRKKEKEKLQVYIEKLT